MDSIDFQVCLDNNKFGPLMAMTLESSVNGSIGPLIDLRLAVRDFGFNAKDIFFPISIFHGLHDKSVPLALAKKISEMLPEARLKVYSDTAHISTYINHFQDIAMAIKG